MKNVQINICGMGPGNPAYILPEVFDWVGKSGLVIGAGRHLAVMAPTCLTTEIDGNIKATIAAIDNAGDKAITVLVSGDTGFYSFFRTLKEHFPDVKFNLVPGISSYQYFFARLGKTYEEAWLGSLHGKEVDFIGKLNDFHKIFLLTDRNHSWKYIAQALVENMMGHYIMHIGNRLSYPDEQIITATAGILAEADYDFLLCSVIIEKDE
jgi:cobalt-precorrin-7 (C5)-methyltransferase